MAKKNDGEGIRTIRPIIANGKTKLAEIDTESTCGFSGEKATTVAVMAELNARLVELQNVLYAEHKHKVLVVLQAMDTGGKDGTIRKVFSGINPQGVRIASFKAPTAYELDRDYLWRVHREVPAKGEIVVFNRSHYEDVLITRVHGWIDDRTAKRRLRQINDFEAMLVEEGTVLLKFFLHISKDEQKQRLEDRLKDDSKTWKFNLGDLEERKMWDEYQHAYEDAINATSSPHAPWHVVPADKKWVRDLYVSSVLVSTLAGLKMKYPDPPAGPDKVRVV
ncbi:MAG: polyphosphate kinase 2 family protein [Betaproteobacteria bacterium]|nr:polyphosphate kinase 2 family protein [Betaproteobacteria bacterium]